MTVLDTNFLIYLLRNKDAAVVADFYDNPKITTITLFELYFGAWRSSKPQENILKINSLLKSVDILAFDNPAAEKAGEIQADLMNSGIPIDIQDVLIAGICIANKEELVTSDIDHFSRIKGLRCRSW
ncbi:MAG: type II toxin-antitoxin system VapC family toxin [Candidatus Methanoperedens sp.]|nr:type II toxin-antitoxin system VapC family toxin [Candidatus Methanoperedens sp.]MCZ7405496.1 type II toxin-antitoxin system VapC family toxin [Candidatus Methanoperedens sp.]